MREARTAFTADVHLFAIPAFTQPGEGAWGNFEFYGNRILTVENLEGALITYVLKAKPAGKVTVTIADAAGQMVRTMDGTGEPGFNRVVWDARGRRGSLTPGDYTVTLQVGEKKLTQKVTMRGRVS
jgi:flagellar hook assembly protein FlgD